jgi:hypothetical protein
MATLVLRAGKGSPLTNAEVDANFTNLNTEVAAAALTASWTGVTGKPATLAGYGITDAQPLDADLTAIAGLAGTSGFLKKTAANTWALDTATYLTGITSGQVTTALGFTPYNATNPSGYITASASITGNAATATSANQLSGISVTDANADRGVGLEVLISTTGATNFPVAAGITLEARRNSGSGSDTGTFQLFSTNDTSETYSIRKVTGYTTANTWSSWRTLLHSGNFNSYSPTLTGTGASGTWGIGITGNAATVTNGLVSTGSYADPAWLTSVNYTKLTGTVPTWNQSTTGNSATATVLQTARNINGVSFNGSADITVADATKLPLAGGTMTGAITFAGAQTWPTFNQSTTGSAATLTTGRTIAMTGDVSWTSGSFNGSANVTGTATLANSGVTAGTYGSATNIPQFAVDAKGRVTSVSNVAVSIPSGSLTFTGDVTGSGSTGSSTALTLANSGVTAGTYTKVTVDAKGRVTAGASLASADLPTYTGTITSAQITTGLGFTPYNATNPSGYITSAALSPYAALSGATFTGAIVVPGESRFYSGTYVDPDSGVGRAIKIGALGIAVLGGVKTDTLNSTGAITQNGSQVLTAGNYNSYSPTLTGTGASGSWGISVTGSSASTTGNAATATALQTARTIGGVSFNGTANINLPGVNAAGNQNTTGTAAGLTDNSSWMLNRGSVAAASIDTATLNGFYTQTNASDSQGVLVFNSGGSLGPLQMTFTYGGLMQFRGKTDSTTWTPWKTVVTSANVSTYALPISGGTLTGAYLDFSNTSPSLRITSGPGTFYIGDDDIVNLGSGAVVATPSSRISSGVSIFSTHAYATGQGDNKTHFGYYNGSSYVNYIRGAATYFDSGTLQIAGNQALHAGNYNSYSPTLTGTGASGTWGISITGNSTYAANSSKLYSTDSSYAYGGSNPYYGYLTFDGSRWLFQVSPGTPAAVRVAYADSAGSVSGGLTTSNYSSYALPLSGGTLSGDVTFGSSNTYFGGSVYLRANTAFSFLTNSGSAQNGRFNGIQVSDSYSGTIPANGILFGTDTQLARSGANALTLGGSLTSTGMVSSGGFGNTDAGIRIANPGGAAYSTQSGTVTGAIKIRLPVAALGSNTMLSFRVRVYQYTAGLTQEFIIAGYNYGDSAATWYNVSAIGISDNASDFLVRFGKDGSSQCVYIGELNSSWSYPQVHVTDFTGGYSSTAYSTWATGWSISFESSTFAGVTNSRTAYRGISPSNIGSYALPLSGGTVNGVVRVNNQLQVGQNTNGTAYIDAFGGIARFSRDNTAYGLHLDGNNYASLVNANGYVTIGPLNTSHSHFQTDRPSFYFNKDVLVDGQLYRYSGNLPYLHSGNYTSYSSFIGAVTSGGNNGFRNDVYYGGVRNPIWSFGNATTYGISYFQGGAGIGGADTFGVSVNGSTSATGVNFAVTPSASYVNNNVVLHAGNYSSYSPSLTGSGASGTWGISITGSSGATPLVTSRDGDRIAGNKLPTSSPSAVRFDFANASSVAGAAGNFAGVMTYAPWDGTSGSTGDSSYQLAFTNQSGVNASGPAQLLLRNGINSTWNGWQTILSSSNYSSYGITRTTGSPAYYGARAWVNFNGTGTVAIRASANVSSITDNGTGNYTVNFSTAMPDQNYAASVGIGSASTTEVSRVGAVQGTTSGGASAKVAGSVTIITGYGWAGGTQDNAEVNVSIFR